MHRLYTLCQSLFPISGHQCCEYNHLLNVEIKWFISFQSSKNLSVLPYESGSKGDNPVTLKMMDL